MLFTPQHLKLPSYYHLWALIIVFPTLEKIHRLYSSAQEIINKDSPPKDSFLEAIRVCKLIDGAIPQLRLHLGFTSIFSSSNILEAIPFSSYSEEKYEFLRNQIFLDEDFENVEILTSLPSSTEITENEEEEGFTSIKVNRNISWEISGNLRALTAISKTISETYIPPEGCHILDIEFFLRKKTTLVIIVHLGFYL
jgi:hypothetical protein